MHILVFEQNGSGQHKTSAIERYGNPEDTLTVVSLDRFFPEFIDEPEEFLSDDFQADLVLNYLPHPDLSHYLIELCKKKGIFVVSSGKHSEYGYTPFTCCGLGRHPSLGSYGERFGLPEYRVELEGEVIRSIEVVRGAPCGASWEIKEVIGATVEEAASLLPRLVQYHCSANPSRFDPVSGKSPVHFAGYAHRAALLKAVEEYRKTRL